MHRSPTLSQSNLAVRAFKGPHRPPNPLTAAHGACTPGLPSSSPPQIPRSYFPRKNSAVFSIPPQAQRHNAYHGVFWSEHDACRVYTTRRRRCLGYCPIRVILPDPLLRLPTRILTGVETFPRCGSCSLALKPTSTASTTTPRARAQPRATHPSMFHRVHRSSPKRRPTLASPLSSSKPAFRPRTSAAHTVASLTVALPYAPATPCTALGSTQTHRSVYRSRAFYPEAAPCASQPDAQQQHRTCPPTFPPVSMYVSPSPAPHCAGELAASGPLRDPANARCSRVDNRRWGGQTRAQVRRGTTPRHRGTTCTYVVANTGVANGSHVAHTRAGAIRAKAKDERGGRFHGRLTHGPTPTSRSRMRMPPPPTCLETRTILPPTPGPHPCPRGNVSEQRLPLRSPLPRPTPSKYPPFGRLFETGFPDTATAVVLAHLHVTALPLSGLYSYRIQ
ncbi:hypothetical protein B0H14DRAFT_2621605 [Mycena olivaceomarginata]|nr:hypothetical protein B0H14DRAFT_2621605 [Mycena olivaceomarginata]